MAEPVQFQESADLDPSVPPSGPGCAECTTAQGWWVHLRRCTACGHIGCCDTSPSQHATAHFHQTGHPIMASYEPGDVWFWNYTTEQMGSGPTLAEPASHPADQTTPGPQERVPDNWRDLIH
ncbi:Zn-finger-containing protein [Knoellia sinensis KCTC 19936]|uniref:Zn-finger-containing protein n=1 Tax=Knoellia sinensis KCTC 19936 TaxID=1385520 RepID=A0A0A0J667_9MICO|nr:UBP-type zinc finger domain-containing protein [Knoellia sinensis]KGN31527.1 Zn-finger-containing protein [Knoellia sinensis KCTC 19936]